MHTITLDLKMGLAFVDSALIEIDGTGALVDSIAQLCSPPNYINCGSTRYHLLGKSSVYGKMADSVIEVIERKIVLATFLFDFIEFFESSILESKIIKTIEKSLNLKFISNHPSAAFLDSCKWGSATFFYDAKQGDLSLEIRFERGSNEPKSKS
jgi:hypothetical protein